MRILTAVQCTGKLHLGNIVAALSPTIKLSEKNENDVFVFLADLHSLTTIKNSKDLKDNTYYAASCWLALGLDPEIITFYRQSRIQGVCELTWIFNCLTPFPMLANAHAFKSKSQKLSDVNVGLFDYPILMAADILLMQSEIVPVGKDQKQHIEIARDVAKAFNNTFGNVFVIPEEMIDNNISLIPGTDGQKMSKSYHNTIDVFASDEQLYKSVMSIKTDSKRPEEPKNPDECIIFNIYKSIADEHAVSVLRNKYLSGGMGYKDAKELLYETIKQKFHPARERFNAVKNDLSMLEKVLQRGEEKAQAVADKTLQEIRKFLYI